jgi:hypothetical protein
MVITFYYFLSRNAVVNCIDFLAAPVQMTYILNLYGSVAVCAGKGVKLLKRNCKVIACELRKAQGTGLLGII